MKRMRARFTDVSSCPRALFDLECPEFFVIPAKAGIHVLVFNGFPPARERRKDNCSEIPLIAVGLFLILSEEVDVMFKHLFTTALVAATVFGATFFMTPAALAAASARNPVVDVSGLVKPGSWKTRLTDATPGKSSKSRVYTECITKAQIHNFLNDHQSIGQGTIKARLDGNRLHAAGDIVVAGKKIGSIEEDFTFDSPERMHAVLTFIVTTDGKTKRDVTRFDAHRVGGCSSSNGNDN